MATVARRRDHYAFVPPNLCDSVEHAVFGDGTSDAGAGAGAGGGGLTRWAMPVPEASQPLQRRDLNFQLNVADAGSVVFAGPWSELVAALSERMAQRTGGMPSQDHVWSALRALSRQTVDSRTEYVLPFEYPGLRPVEDPAAAAALRGGGDVAQAHSSALLSISGWPRPEKPSPSRFIVLKVYTGALLELEGSGSASRSVDRIADAVDTIWSPADIPDVKYVLPGALSPNHPNLFPVVHSRRGTRVQVMANTFCVTREMHAAIDTALTGAPNPNEAGDAAMSPQVLDLDSVALMDHLRTIGCADEADRVMQLAASPDGRRLHPLHPLRGRAAAMHALKEQAARAPRAGCYPEDFRRQADATRRSIQAVVAAVRRSGAAGVQGQVSDADRRTLAEAVRRDSAFLSRGGDDLAAQNIDPVDAVVQAFLAPTADARPIDHADGEMGALLAAMSADAAAAAAAAAAV
jgi:hypothetical protein